MARIDGGALLARSLQQAGVTEVFTLHGGHLDAFLMAAEDYGLRLTDTRHESTAGHAADAYARLTGKPGVCVTTSGPGFTNVYSAITNAYLDASPVLFIVGSPPLREAETNPLQGGFDQVAAAYPVTKWAHQVTNVERIPELVALALRHATTGKPGPVLLDVPIDVMFYPVDDEYVRWPAYPADIPRPAPSPAGVQAVLAALASASRPAILTGGGALLSGCAAELRTFAERCSIPVFTNKGQGILPGSHPLWAGGTFGLATLSMVVGETPDLLIILGHRFGLFTGGRHSYVPGATIIQVDVDSAEMGRLHDVAVPILADVRTALEAFNAAAADAHLPDFSEWAKKAITARQLAQQLFPDDSTPSGRIHPNAAARELLGATPGDAVVVFDGAEAGAWAGFYTAAETPGGVFTFGYLGCLGVGQGYAIGAARARPGVPVVLVTGDGAVGFHISEFDTMVRHELPVITAVFNNMSWGLSKHGQEVIYPGRKPVVTTLPDTAFEQVARAFGADGHRIEDAGQIAAAVQAALASGKPTCLNLAVDGDIVHPGGVAGLSDVNSTTEIVVPYYDNIPLKQA